MKDIFIKTKTHKIFWAIAIILTLIVVLEVGLVRYDVWKMRKDMKDFVEQMDREAKEKQEAMEADKIGGKTPQETLEMFISAVEEGDFERASKYFVIEKQEEWKEYLNKAKKLPDLLGLLNEVLRTNKEPNVIDDYFSFYKPIAVDFILYPSGNWKIEEI